MKKGKVAVGTRAFNAEKTIEQTVNSVLGQSENDLQYWVLNNGSTDKTGEILDRLACGDSRLQVIHYTENDPSFSSMEMLINHADAEYFMLLDSDDWLENECIRTLYEAAKSNDVEVAVAGSVFHYVDTGKTGYRRSELEGLIPRHQIPLRFPQLHQFFRPVWGKIFEADLVKDSWLGICESRPSWLSYGGDTYTCFELLKHVRGIYITAKCLHNYRVHSASSSYIYSADRFLSDKFLYDHENEFLKSFGPVSDKNMMFLLQVYYYAIKDTIRVLDGSNESIEHKAGYLTDILKDERMKLILTEMGNVDARRQLLTYIEHYLKEDYKGCKNISGLCREILKWENLLDASLANAEMLIEEKDALMLFLFGEQKASYKELMNKYEDLTVDDSDYIDYNMLIMNLSALLGDSNVFVGVNKALLRYYTDRDVDKALYYLGELVDMIPADPEVVKYRTYLLEGN